MSSSASYGYRGDGGDFALSLEIDGRAIADYLEAVGDTVPEGPISLPELMAHLANVTQRMGLAGTVEFRRPQHVHAGLVAAAKNAGVIGLTLKGFPSLVHLQHPDKPRLLCGHKCGAGGRSGYYQVEHWISDGRQLCTTCAQAEAEAQRHAAVIGFRA